MRFIWTYLLVFFCVFKYNTRCVLTRVSMVEGAWQVTWHKTASHKRITSARLWTDNHSRKLVRTIQLVHILNWHRQRGLRVATITRSWITLNIKSCYWLSKRGNCSKHGRSMWVIKLHQFPRVPTLTLKPRLSQSICCSMPFVIVVISSKLVCFCLKTCLSSTAVGVFVLIFNPGAIL